ncbi:hypothetical protein STENM223S_02444 [Streptomyces tendae]
MSTPLRPVLLVVAHGSRDPRHAARPCTPWSAGSGRCVRT